MDIAGALKFLFAKKEPLRVAEVDFATLEKTPQPYMQQIVQRRHDAVVVRNFLTAAELGTLKDNINALPPNLLDVPHPGAKTFPPACSAGGVNHQVVATFFQNSATYNKQLNDLTAVDITGRFAALIAMLNGGSKPELAINRQGGAPYVHGTFRMIEPVGKGMGLTSPHTGYDYALRNLKFSYAPLAPYVDIFKQLSLFTVIDMPETGGDFTVFNYNRSEYPILQDDTLKKQNGRGTVKLYGKKNTHTTFKLMPGDAFLFADFDLWHRVEPFTGNKMRLSYGCWMSYGLNSNQLYYWS